MHYYSFHLCSETLLIFWTGNPFHCGAMKYKSSAWCISWYPCFSSYLHLLFYFYFKSIEPVDQDMVTYTNAEHLFDCISNKNDEDIFTEKNLKGTNICETCNKVKKAEERWMWMHENNILSTSCKNKLEWEQGNQSRTSFHHTIWWPLPSFLICSLCKGSTLDISGYKSSLLH